VSSRLSVYQEQTSPLIEYYKAEGLLKTVDGDQTVEKVFEDIVKVLEK
jgi:adenylate kinase